MAAPEIVRRRWKYRRPDLDLTEVRYFIYWLYDADGQVVYIGRSCDPISRLRAHHTTGAEWAPRVVQIEWRGPFTWPEACKRERDAIDRAQPPGNRMYVRTHRRVG
jgi:predicted GIY-YIG superfamily endonuclease